MPRPAPRLDLAAELHRLTFAPLRQAVAGAAELTIVPDGPLHYVPFLTLRDAQATEKPYLVQNYGVALASALRLISSRTGARPASWTASSCCSGRSGVPRGRSQAATIGPYTLERNQP